MGLHFIDFTAMTQDEQKQAVARAAIAYVVDGEIVGVGTGSTANFFIDELATIKHRIKGAVASSEATANRLAAHGIPVFDLNQIDSMPVYIDGADEINATGAMIKGGGGALTREKIVASVADQFICIADGSKLVEMLGTFPLPVEVIPMAHKAVAAKLVAMGGLARLRIKNGNPVMTDNGNVIIDVTGLRIVDPVATERAVNALAGVVTVGLFAARGADVALLCGAQGIQTLTFKK